MARKPGFRHAEETKAKIAAANSKPCLEATRQKIAISMTGRHLTEAHRAALVQSWSRRKGLVGVLEGGATG